MLDDSDEDIRNFTPPSRTRKALSEDTKDRDEVLRNRNEELLAKIEELETQREEQEDSWSEQQQRVSKDLEGERVKTTKLERELSQCQLELTRVHEQTVLQLKDERLSMKQNMQLALEKVAHLRDVLVEQQEDLLQASQVLADEHAALEDKYVSELRLVEQYQHDQARMREELQEAEHRLREQQGSEMALTTQRFKSELEEILAVSKESQQREAQSLASTLKFEEAEMRKVFVSEVAEPRRMVALLRAELHSEEASRACGDGASTPDSDSGLPTGNSYSFLGDDESFASRSSSKHNSLVAGKLEEGQGLESCTGSHAQGESPKLPPSTGGSPSSPSSNRSSPKNPEQSQRLAGLARSNAVAVDTLLRQVSLLGVGDARRLDCLTQTVGSTHLPTSPSVAAANQRWSATSLDTSRTRLGEGLSPSQRGVALTSALNETMGRLEGLHGRLKVLRPSPAQRNAALT